MRKIKPSELAFVSKRDPKRKGLYNPSAYLRQHEGILEQMWWSDAGDAVWESIAQSPNLSLKDIALGKK